MNKKNSSLQFRYIIHLAVWALGGLNIGCGSRTSHEEATLSNPVAGRERVSRESELQFPIYSPPPRVIGSRTDTLLRLRSLPMGPHQPPLLYESPQSYGCYFLPHEVE